MYQNYTMAASISILTLPRSYDGKYFASLGGQDDNSVVIWETETGRAVCGSPAAQDSALSVKWLHHRNDRFVTAGNFHLRVWQVDVSIPKVRAGSCLWWKAGGGLGGGGRAEAAVGTTLSWALIFPFEYHGCC